MILHVNRYDWLCTTVLLRVFYDCETFDSLISPRSNLLGTRSYLVADLSPLGIYCLISFDVTKWPIVPHDVVLTQGIEF